MFNKYLNKKKLFIFALCLSMGALNFSISFSQSVNLQYEMVSYTEGGRRSGNVPLFSGINLFSKPTFTIGDYQSYKNGYQFFFDLIIGVSIATAVILFMVAALKEIFNSSSVKDIKAGKDGMINALTGLMIILSSWLIINTINPDLLRLPVFSGLDKLGVTANGQPAKTGVSGNPAARQP